MGVSHSRTPGGERIFIEVNYGNGQAGAFAVLHGVLIETVDRTADGNWDWSLAGECDSVRGSNPELQRALERALEAVIRHGGSTTLTATESLAVGSFIASVISGAGDAAIEDVLPEDLRVAFQTAREKLN
jgi:hypothetical protein